MYSILLVMSGGAIGAGLRFGLSRALPYSGQGWPWSTFVANILGGLAMGILTAWVLRGDNSAEPLRLFVGVGVLGGFTTFSAFSLEMARMIEQGQTGLAAGYALASVLLALGALFAGMTAAKAFWA
ncbi:fluoride efflux transporter FluC [Sphingorhabdus lacus]|uniref:fluoride efflux transporter FluC n=1 Tax=Sphingorhabdus lacus TaxID=392610 RepID=UPI0035930C97